MCADGVVTHTKLVVNQVNYDEGLAHVQQVVVLELQRLLKPYKSSEANAQVLDEVAAALQRVLNLQMSTSVPLLSVLVLGGNDEVIYDILAAIRSLVLLVRVAMLLAAKVSVAVLCSSQTGLKSLSIDSQLLTL